MWTSSETTSASSRVVVTGTDSDSFMKQGIKSRWTRYVMLPSVHFGSFVYLKDCGDAFAFLLMLMLFRSSNAHGVAIALMGFDTPVSTPPRREEDNTVTATPVGQEEAATTTAAVNAGDSDAGGTPLVAMDAE